MALIKCKECGKEISETAERCPSCGCVTNHGEEQKNAKMFLLLYVVDFLELGAGVFFLLKGDWIAGAVWLAIGGIGVFSTNKQTKKFLGEK